MPSHESTFQKGTLFSALRKATLSALRYGALQPIATHASFIHDGGIDFLVRIVSNLNRKRRDKEKAQKNDTDNTPQENPFLPYDERMFVADISDTHLCLLNKYNVIENHVLVVTRHYEDQERLLTLQDFNALWRCMAEFDSLGFYNGGKEAGASQPHKHLQMIPLPMADRPPTVPLESILHTVRWDSELGTFSAFPFQHAVTKLDTLMQQPYERSAETPFRLYRTLLHRCGMNRLDESADAHQSGPYNLLLTRDWMLLVPRSKEFFDSISINALGYAGALLVQNEAQLSILKQHGGMAILKHTALPIPTAGTAE